MSDEIPLRTPSYRVDRPRGMDPSTRRLVFIAAGLGGALLVLIGAWSMVGGRTSGAGGVPVIAPPAGPMRVKPAHPGGMKVPGADQSIFRHSSNGRDAAAGSLMPAPERPDLAALHPPPAGPAGTAPAGAASPALPLPPDFPPATLAAATPHPASPALAVPPAGGTAGGPAGSPVGASGAPQVQFAALPTHAAARQEWATLRHRLPQLLAHRRLLLREVRIGGRTWWRVRTAGFASAAEARHFCARARAAGTTCDVTPF